MKSKKGSPSGGGAKAYVVLAVVGVGTLLMAMAGFIVNLALPNLGRELGLSIEDSRWVVQAYLLAVGVLLLLIGRLSDLWGHRRVYLIGFFLFGATSLGCGLATSFGALVAFRAFQGVGGAMIMASGPALLTTAFPAQVRGRALGLLATATYTGLTLGPPVGGVIVSVLSWRWAFLMAVPTSLIVLAVGLPFLPRDRPSKKAPFDWAGALALLFGMPLLLLAISEGQQWGLTAWRTWSAAGLGLLGLVTFVLLQRHHPSPLLDLSLFHSPIFTGAVISAMANYIALFVAIMLLPFYLEEGLGLDPAAAGLILAVQPLLMAMVASPSGWLSDRLGSRGLATLGMLVLAAGLGGTSCLGSESRQGEIMAWMALVGLGTGIFISPNSSALMGAAQREQQGIAGSILAEARVLGMLLGVAIATSLFHGAGGRTGEVWRPEEFAALNLALRVAAGVALAGAVAASLRGRHGRKKQA